MLITEKLMARLHKTCSKLPHNGVNGFSILQETTLSAGGWSVACGDDSSTQSSVPCGQPHCDRAEHLKPSTKILSLLDQLPPLWQEYGRMAPQTAM